MLFDQKMIATLNKHHDFNMPVEKVMASEIDQVIAFRRGSLLFVFNLNPTKSFAGYGVPVNPADYKTLMTSDQSEFEGFGNIDPKMIYEPNPVGKIGEGYHLLLYLPSRTSLVLEEVPVKRIRP